MVRLLMLLIALCLFASACARSAAPTAEVVSAGAPQHAVPAVVAIAQRLQSNGAGTTPRVEGMTLPRARRRMATRPMQVVRVGPGRLVTAQWPPPGAAADVTTLWVGRPETLPVAAAEPAPTAEPELPPSPAAGPPADPPKEEPTRQRHSEEPSASVEAAPEPVASPTNRATPKPRSPVPRPSAALELAGESLSGRASWYGPGFEGNRTACGQRFDPSLLTLASRELECGTAVRVTGPTGRTVEATVNDWGPAGWTNRRFDLSRRTFAAVASLGAGVIDVTVQPLR